MPILVVELVTLRVRRCGAYAQSFQEISINKEQTSGRIKEAIPGKQLCACLAVLPVIGQTIRLQGLKTGVDA
jgi:hypothetical protein